MDNLTVLKGYDYHKLNTFVDQADYGMVQDHNLTYQLKDSLSLGFWNRFKITVLSCFYSDDSIAKLVADVVRPHLNALKPKQTATTTLAGRAAPHAAKAAAPVSGASSSTVAPAQTGKRHRKEKKPAQETRRSESAPARLQSTPAAPLLQFGKNAKHTISFGEGTVQITCEEDLIGQLQSFIIPGERGGLTSTITIDNQSVKICDHPVLAKAFETAKKRIDIARDTVHKENGGYGQHACVVLADQVAAAARRRAQQQSAVVVK